MVYAMMSIGVLGFVVWSQWLAFPSRDLGVIIFAICWNSLVLLSCFYITNAYSIVESAGNLSKSSSETTREKSFNFDAFRLLTKISCVAFSNKRWMINVVHRFYGRRWSNSCIREQTFFRNYTKRRRDIAPYI